ncbi:NAD(P)/FAD-dependent oxidoreductase [Halorubellus sp. JP-L1]|uniref:FAD-dependent oxidoreductase n=1 Tax=Halorubellus sp. JP-L1 TaxID=2715753 RepID=UPI00140C9D3A|nr:FAD-dependent oxidoreductase [Halorubellus sp. JP-L1]NHN42325.1 NAD(P)/FAD-dependent oxidoreductase [Halorubellus sp. JP-L1]
MEYDVCVVGGGVAGLTASTFVARGGLETVVVDDGNSILQRNAHLENFTGFPQGVDARRLLERTRRQAEHAGVTFVDGRVTDVVDDSGEDDDATAESTAFAVSVDDGSSFSVERVIAASWSDASYLPAAVAAETRGTKAFVEVDADGRTSVGGIYAAGRLADQYHQAIVCAGHGATVGVTVVHDSDEAFYHDWVVPEGYFTGRGREVPPGCEEIDDAERLERDAAAREANATYTVALDDDPVMHPSVRDTD